MKWARSRTSSYVAAALLSLLTLTTFYLLRNYGPGWAIRRFHAAVQSGDAREVATVSIQLPDSPDMRRLESIISQSQSFDIETAQQSTDEAVFDIRYYLRGGHVDVNWVVERTNAGWLIDAKRTLEGSPDLTSS